MTDLTQEELLKKSSIKNGCEHELYDVFDKTGVKTEACVKCMSVFINGKEFVPIDLTLATMGKAPCEPHDIIERIEELAFPDTIKEQKDGYIETFVIRKDDWEALKKEFSPAKLGKGKTDSESDLGKSKISKPVLQPESSAGDEEIVEKVLKELKRLENFWLIRTNRHPSQLPIGGGRLEFEHSFPHLAKLDDILRNRKLAIAEARKIGIETSITHETLDEAMDRMSEMKRKDLIEHIVNLEKEFHNLLVKGEKLGVDKTNAAVLALLDAKIAEIKKESKTTDPVMMTAIVLFKNALRELRGQIEKLR